MDLILTLSPSSSEAERGFSQMVKTTLRSKMNGKSLNETMGIKLMANSIKDFDPMPAINLWNESSLRSRRPCHREAEDHSTAFRYFADSGDVNELDEELNE